METHIYDGMDPSEEFDDYDAWFEEVSGGEDPLATHPSWSDTPLTLNDWRGAAYMYNESWHPTAWTANTAAEVIATHSESESSASPLFLKISFHRPHSPYDPPARLLDQFEEADMPARVVAADGWDRGVAGVCASSLLNYTEVDVNTVDPNMWCGDIGAEQVVALSRPAYAASVQFVDEGVGVVLAALDAAGMSSNTAILYTSDHGDALGDHNLWRKTYPYEASSRIPLALWFGSDLANKLRVATSAVANANQRPRTASDVVSGFVTELRDVMPTLLDLAGVLDQVPADQPLDGSSLLPLLSTKDGTSREARAAWRRWIDLEHGESASASAPAPYSSPLLQPPTATPPLSSPLPYPWSCRRDVLQQQQPLERAHRRRGQIRVPCTHWERAALQPHQRPGRDRRPRPQLPQPSVHCRHPRALARSHGRPVYAGSARGRVGDGRGRAGEAAREHHVLAVLPLRARAVGRGCGCLRTEWRR